MAELWNNNAGSVLAAGIGAGDTSLTVSSGHGALFPSPTGGDYFYVTLDNGASLEIVRCTARSGDTLTITRAQQGTSAAAWDAGTPVQHRLTAEPLTRFEAGTPAAWTLGRIMFHGVAGVDDDALLNWNNTAKRLGVGTTAGTTAADPVVIVRGDGLLVSHSSLLVENNIGEPILNVLRGNVVIGNDVRSNAAFGDTNSVFPRLQVLAEGANASMLMGRWDVNANSARIYFTKSRGAAIGNHGVLLNNDILGEFEFSGSDGTIYRGGARISARVDEPPVPGARIAGRIEFAVNDGVSASALPALIVKSTRNVGIGGVTPAADNRLQTRGPGTTSATNSFRAENSAGNAGLVVRDDRLTTVTGSLVAENAAGINALTANTDGELLSGNREMVPGTRWTSRTSAADNEWRAVTYGNGLFVAVANSGSGNRVMTSPDGINWTIRTTPVDNLWRGVTYGNGLFVAVAFSGTGNRVMTSPDGIDWTLRTSAADNDWFNVTYGNGLFVAVAFSGSGNRVMTSPDGINWTIRTTPADNDWISVTYGNGLFVAVAFSGSGNRVMTSPDGINWTIGTTPADNGWFSVIYGNGLFVAVANSGTGNRVMTSPDGINWTLRTSAADNAWRGVTYGNGLFVAVAGTGPGNRVMTSPDGINWTIRTSAANVAWRGVTYGNGLFVAVADSGTGNRVMTSGFREQFDDSRQRTFYDPHPQVGSVITGHYYQYDHHGMRTRTVNRGLTPNQWAMFPFVPQYAVRPSALSVWVDAGVNCRVAIYDSDPVTGWPDQLIWDSGDFVSAAGMTDLPGGVPTLVRGRVYWLAHNHDTGTVGWRAFPGTAATPATGVSSRGLGSIGTAASDDQAVGFIRAAAFGAPPSPWVFDAAELLISGTGATVLYFKG